MRSAMVRMASPWRAANSSRSGMRAICPSSRMISQITPAGSRPARRARSTDPSVWPVRTSTPPRRALSGKTCPGDTRSDGRVSRATAVLMVTARSCAEMPVVTPWRASMDTVKAVPIEERFSCTIMGSASSWIRSSVRVRQMRPRPWRAMKLMASGVTRSAAMHRSPSFSRSSSSTRMIMRPWRIASMAQRTRSCFSVASGGVAVIAGPGAPSRTSPRTCRPGRPRGSRARRPPCPPGWSWPGCAG